MSPTGIFVFLACAYLCGVLALQDEKGLEPTQFNGSQTGLGEVPTDSGYSAENDIVEDEVGGDVGSGLPDLEPIQSRQQQQCPCGDDGLEWEKVVHLNLSDLAQACPMGLNLTAHPVRGCGRSSLGSGCDSILFSVHNHTYTRVCGQVQAYQKGSSHAFFNALQLDLSTVEEAYVSGVSLTYGKPGSRSHVWTFAGAQSEQEHTQPFLVCSCSNNNREWRYNVPTFIGNDYFCDSGFRSQPMNGEDVSEDLLWDGKGCGDYSTCCSFGPPFFCTTLDQPTTEDLELRLCATNAADQEDKLISLVDIYIQY